jgi:hypothetical protein
VHDSFALSMLLAKTGTARVRQFERHHFHLFKRALTRVSSTSSPLAHTNP